MILKPVDLANASSLAGDIVLTNSLLALHLSSSVALLTQTTKKTSVTSVSYWSFSLQSSFFVTSRAMCLRSDGRKSACLLDMPYTFHFFLINCSANGMPAIPVTPTIRATLDDISIRS